jgi:DNA-binding beta-propeller fold protein YncE
MAQDKAHIRIIVNQDGAAVLDTERGTISTLNTTGAYIWQALERGEREEQIAEGLARETGESLNVIRQDVSGFIAALHEQKILEC